MKERPAKDGKIKICLDEMIDYSKRPLIIIHDNFRVNILSPKTKWQPARRCDAAGDGRDDEEEMKDG